MIDLAAARPAQTVDRVATDGLLHDSADPIGTEGPFNARVAPNSTQTATLSSHTGLPDAAADGNYCIHKFFRRNMAA